jgi:hypothetical protein
MIVYIVSPSNLQQIVLRFVRRIEYTCRGPLSLVNLTPVSFLFSISSYALFKCCRSPAARSNTSRKFIVQRESERVDPVNYIRYMGWFRRAIVLRSPDVSKKSKIIGKLSPYQNIDNRWYN